MCLWSNGGGTRPSWMRSANPCTNVVFPTPGSPIRSGLFFVLRIKMRTILSNSWFLPIRGSIELVSANRVMFSQKRLRVGNFVVRTVRILVLSAYCLRVRCSLWTTWSVFSIIFTSFAVPNAEFD